MYSLMKATANIVRVSTKLFASWRLLDPWVRAVCRAGFRNAASRLAILEFCFFGKPTAKIHAGRHVSPIKGSLKQNFGFFFPGTLTMNSVRRWRSHCLSAAVLPPANACPPHTQTNFVFNFSRRHHCSLN